MNQFDTAAAYRETNVLALNAGHRLRFRSPG
jgi:hypothetical protein